MKKFFLEKLVILSVNQKKHFLEYIPKKVYKTERNIAIIVVFTQLMMIFLFLINRKGSFDDWRGMMFFSLYNFLLIATLMAIFAYRYTFSNNQLKAYLWTRRIYAAVMCIWVVGITFLEQMNGKSGSTYCYLLPTMAAVLLLTPLESTVLFGFSWLSMAFMFLTNSNSHNIFGNMVNSIFVTVLTLFISYRYYRSMAVEFCDRETISHQYQEIEVTNNLLQKMAHIDQLTNLYNRHYLIEEIYPLFEKCKKEQYFGMFLMMDIDYFKQYNDTYGHIQGDECIQFISNELLLRCQCHNATAIRYGGEEFLIIKMIKHELDADYFAEELLNAVRSLDITRDDIEAGRVTMSIGLWHGALAEIPHIEAAIKNADTALYEAKKAGRNQIVEYKINE